MSREEQGVSGGGSAHPGIDEGSVLAWFADEGIEHTAPLEYTRIGLGQSNLTYLVRDADGRRWVLRRPPIGHLLQSAHDVAREARILTALGPSDVPTPHVYSLLTDERFTDVPMLLMEFVDGTVIDTMEVAESLSPAERRAVGLAMPANLARIHAVDLKEVGLDDLGSHSPYAQRQLKRWTGQWEKSKTRDSAEFDALTKRLAAAVPEQTETTLVHGDFHLRNVIAEPAKGELVAILDWELTTLGDPLADIGSLLAYWPEPDDSSSGGFIGANVEGFPMRSELAAAYVGQTGRDPAALQFWHAMALWKLTVIAEGVMRRGMDNPENRASAGTPMVELVDGILRRAVEVADSGGI